MSLRIWLPLTKDLRQQGLSNVTVINNGATFNSAGKLGGCYQFDGSNDNFTYTPNVDSLETFSIALWLCPTTSTPAGAFFSLERDTYWQVTFYGTNVAIRDDSIGWNGTRKNYSSGTYTANVWTHLVVTYNKGILKIYRDGNLLSTNTVGGSKLNTGINNARVGSAVQDGYYYAGKINDVRFYDHCLSLMEVKELAKGLVLHYPLNRQGWGQENLILNSNTFATGSGANGITPSTTADGLHQVIATSGNSNWHSSWATSTATSLLENTFAEGDPFTISFTIKSENANKTNPPTIYVKSGMGYYTMQGKVGPNWSTIYYSGTWKDKNLIAFHLGFSGLVGTYLFKNWKVEKGSVATPWCPNSSDALATTMGLNSTTEYDCSGFENNGTRVGTFSWTSDTPKYSVSTKFPNNCNTWIANTDFPQITKNLTFACWCKIQQGASSSFSFIVSQGRDNTKSGFNIILNGTEYALHGSFGALKSGVTVDNTWKHIVGTYDGTTIKIYINGELKNSMSYTSDLTYTYGPALVIGKMAFSYTSTANYFPTNGNISDVRIYATALSADDVKSLYQNSAYIDSSGNVYGAVHEEV